MIATQLGLYALTAWAFVDCQVRPVSGPNLSRATVVVEGSRIRQLAVDAPVPPGAETIPCQGQVLTPGLIEPHTTLGLVEVGLEPLSNDAMVDLPMDPVRAALRAQDAVDPRSTLVGVARRQGITSVAVVPPSGVVSGQAAWMNLVHPRSVFLDDAVVGPVALAADFTEDGAQGAGMSRMVAFTHLREFVDDVKAYLRSPSSYLRRDLYAMPWSRLDLVGASDAARGRMPLMVLVNRAADIRAVLNWGRQERLDLVLVHAAEGWMVADEIAAARVPVIVNPLTNLPERFESRHARADNAALLARAGVEVMLSTGSAHLAGTLRVQAGNAIREGLSPERALAGITSIPARVFGQRGLGVIEPGATANLVLWSQDPFEPTSHAEVVMIRGEVQPTRDRQTALAEHHLERLRAAQASEP